MQKLIERKQNDDRTFSKYLYKKFQYIADFDLLDVHIPLHSISTQYISFLTMYTDSNPISELERAKCAAIRMKLLILHVQSADWIVNRNEMLIEYS